VITVDSHVSSHAHSHARAIASRALELETAKPGVRDEWIIPTFRRSTTLEDGLATLARYHLSLARFPRSTGSFARASPPARRSIVVAPPSSCFTREIPHPRPREDAVAEPLESVDEADAETVARLDREMTAIGRARSVSAWSLRTDETTAARRRRLDRI